MNNAADSTTGVRGDVPLTLGRLETQQFEDQLHAAMIDVPPRHFLVVLGDFNAAQCAAAAQQIAMAVLSGATVLLSTTLRRGSCRTSALPPKLSVANTFFQHCPVHKLNFRSSRNQEHLLNFVLVRRKFLNSVRNVRVLRGANGCGEYTQSVHHLVCATICLQLKAHRPRAPGPDVAALQDPETAAQIAAAAEAKLPSPHQLQQQPAAAILDALAAAVASAASEVLPELQHSSSHGLVQPSPALHALLRRQQAMVAQFRQLQYRRLTRSTAPVQAELRSVTQDICRGMRWLKRAATTELGEALEAAAVKGHGGEAHL
jgi:hypothetical protein